MADVGVDGGGEQPPPSGSDVQAPQATGPQPDTQAWTAMVQAYYKQAQGSQPGQPLYPATIAATHPYAGFWPGQPLMHGAPFYYGGMLPYGYPPAPVAVSGAEGEAGADPSAGSPTKRDTPQQGQSQPGSAKTGSPGAGGDLKRAKSDTSQQQQSSADGAPPPLPAAAAGAQNAQSAAALAALAAAQAAAGPQQTPEMRDFWLQRAGQLAGSQVNLQDLSGAQSGQNGQLDEREVKRQKRKQSNRESARRSRLRKQSECEELAVRVKELQSENARLKEQNRELQMKLEKLDGGQQGMGDMRREEALPPPSSLLPEPVMGSEREAADALHSVATAAMQETLHQQQVAPLPPPQPSYQPDEMRQVAV